MTVDVARDKIKLIRSYLDKCFPEAEKPVEHRPDFDSGCEKFKVSLKDGAALLRVSGRLLRETTGEDIPNLFDRWGVATALAKSRPQGVLVTLDGISQFSRE